MTSHEIKETPSAVTPGEPYTVEQVAKILQNISDRVDGMEIKINIITQKVQSLKPQASTFHRGGVM